VTAIAALAAISFVLADAHLGGEARVSAPAARPLPVASLFALPAPLTAGLGRQVGLVVLGRDKREGRRRWVRDNRLFPRRRQGSRGHGSGGAS